MTTFQPSRQQEIDRLKAELESIRDLVARSEITAQNLRDAQHKLDVHLEEFARIHQYARQAFSSPDRRALYATIIEGIVDVFQLEIGAVFSVDFADQKLTLLESLNFTSDRKDFDLPPAFWDRYEKSGFSSGRAVCESPVQFEPWSTMGLSSVVFMAFDNIDNRISTLMLGAVSKEGETVFDFVPKELISPFMVYCQQMNDILGLVEAVNEARQAGRAKTRFLANLSHEIRTPMNAIIGMAQVARRSNDAEELKRCIGQIDISSKHLLALINDVLDISKIDDGKFKLNSVPFDLHALVDTVLSSMTPLAQNKSQDLHAEFHDVRHAQLFGDDVRLSQVLINLLGNAVKFTPEQGRIRLDISEFSRDDESVTLQFSVSDTGIGIGPEFMSRLFSPFEQADDGISRDYGGTGLGLAISKYIVELMGGQLRVNSVQGHGTCFSFSIRFQITWITPRTETGGVDDILDFSGRRILIVDDVKINRVVLASLLKDTNIEVDEAENGKEAIDKLLAVPPGYYTLVFMDVQMPVMDGCAATRFFRSTERPDALILPIIAMTANVFKDDVQEVLNAGMNGHIGKPVELSIILDTIRKTIQAELF